MHNRILIFYRPVATLNRNWIASKHQAFVTYRARTATARHARFVLIISPRHQAILLRKRWRPRPLFKPRTDGGFPPDFRYEFYGEILARPV